MSETKRNVPKLRFPGFTEDWEQRKLWELYERVNERNDGTLGRDKWISVAKMYFQDPDKVQSNNLDTRTYVMQLGDIAFEGHPNNEFKFGRFVLNDIGTGIISELFPIYRAIVEYDLNFWKYAIQLERTMAPIFAKSITSSGNSSNKLNQNHFLQQSITIPTVEEQKVIGSFLENISNLITLHQRKLENLKLKKKALLQKLFPKNGEQIPELRFPGFTDDWEQRKLGDVIASLYNGQTPSRFDKANWEGDIPWLTSGELNRGVVNHSIEKITQQGRDDANLKIVPKGTVVIAITGLEAAGTRGNCAKLGFNTTLNQSCMAIYPKSEFLDPDFLFQWYIAVGEEYGIKYTQGTKQQSYNAELIKILPISVPSVTEQRKITRILDLFDDIITLHQRKLEHLQLQKKALLQQMFV